MTQTQKAKYLKFRAAEWTADRAYRAAAILERFEGLEAEGHVALEAVPDDCSDVVTNALENCFDVDDCDDAPGGRRAVVAQRKAYLKRVERDGVYGIVGKLPGIDDNVDSVWGFDGYDDPADPYENAYVVDIMSATLDAFDAVEYCPHCKQVIKG